MPPVRHAQSRCPCMSTLMGALVIERGKQGCKWGCVHAGAMEVIGFPAMCRRDERCRGGAGGDIECSERDEGRRRSGGRLLWAARLRARGLRNLRPEARPRQRVHRAHLHRLCHCCDAPAAGEDTPADQLFTFSYFPRFDSLYVFFVKDVQFVCVGKKILCCWRM